MCFGFTNEIPKNVKELDLMFFKDAHLQILDEIKGWENSHSIYCMVKKKGGGKLIVKEVLKNQKI